MENKDMAVNNKLQLGVINITVHPHTQDDYIELLQSASKIYVKEFQTKNNFKMANRERNLNEIVS